MKLFVSHKLLGKNLPPSPLSLGTSSHVTRGN